MENIIVIAILILILLFAIFRTVRHFKGGSGCCSSGGGTIRDKKTLTGPVIEKKTLTIEGMTCVNCEIRVENALNRLDGVLSKVNWKKKTADISCSTEIPDETLRKTVENLGYEVTSIRR